MTLHGSNASHGSGAPAAGAAHASTQDIQNLVALLGSLMPLLTRLQSQSADQLFQFGPINPMIPNPMLDHQAAVNLAEDITADSLRRLSAYLETNAPRYQGLEGCVAIAAQAAHCFGIRDYAGAFDLILQAYRVITGARAINPQLPPLRSTEALAPAAPIH
jgi:hypothetical protein